MRVLFALLPILLVACSATETSPATASSPSASAASAPSSGMADAYMRRMHSDLRNLLTAQEIHYSRVAPRYAGPAEDVNSLEDLRYVTSQDVSIRIVEATERGWSGVASSPELPGRGCAIFVGNAAPPATPGGILLTTPGVVTCD